MRLIGCALAAAFASSAHAEAIQLTCKVESEDIGYYGPTGNLKAGKPTHHSYTVEYVLDYAGASITVESRFGRSVMKHNPDFGSSVLTDANGITAKIVSSMPGGFETRDYLHFDAGGLRGAGKSEMFSRGNLVRHSAPARLLPARVIYRAAAFHPPTSSRRGRLTIDRICTANQVALSSISTVSRSLV